MPSPAFQFYANDWLSSPRIMVMTLAEEGAYIRLLAYDWANDGIPDDDDRLAVLSRMGDGWLKGGSTTLRTCFASHPRKQGYLTNPRLEQERKKQEAWRSKSRDGGKKSAQKRLGDSEFGKNLAGQRWSMDANQPTNQMRTNGQQPCEPNANSSSSSSSSSSEETHTDAKGGSTTPEPPLNHPSEVIVPSLQEVLEWGKMDGVPEETCRNFFNHHAGLGWMYGKTPIRNPRAWLRSFEHNGRRVRVNGSNGSRTGESNGSIVFQKKTRLEALEKLIEEHPGHPNANYSSPATPAERQEYGNLMTEAKKLRTDLAKGIHA